MKKTLIFICVLIMCTSAFSQNSDATEISLFNDIISCYKTGYSTGIIEKADLLEKKYPESVFLKNALVYKSEAQIKLYDYDNAISNLQKVISTMHLGSENFSKCYFLLGKAYYLQNKTDDALKAFYTACSISQKEKDYTFYNTSIIYSARIYYNSNQFEKSLPLFEYIISKGKQYSKTDYDEALQKLFVVYSNTENFEKTILLYESISAEHFSKPVYEFITMYVAEAYDKKNQFQKAYNLYSFLMGSENQNTAVSALQKAYIISSKSDVTVEPADVLEKINRIHNDSQKIIAEFWTRLGIDSYKNKDYEKSKECFSHAKENYTFETDCIIKIYENKILLDTATNENRKNIAKVVETALLENEKDFLSAQVKNISDAYYSILLYCKAIQEEWQIIPEMYQKIGNYDSQTHFLAATAYFKLNDLNNAEHIIKKDLVSPNNLSLYALILANQGKYSEAEKNYQKLIALSFENQITAKEKMEYAKVLFNLGKWNEAKTVALETKLVQSEYLAGLCDLKMENYQSAIKHLQFFEENISNSPYKSKARFYSGYAMYMNGDYQKAYGILDSYTSDFDNKSDLAHSAFELAAKSALMFGDYEKAAEKAEALLNSTEKNTEKYTAAIFCSQIYTDSKKFDKAISILEPFTLLQSEISIKALFQTASIYEKADDIEKASFVYNKIYTDFPETPEAEEAMYRCGELFYSHGNYQKAENRFVKYIYNYVNGRFSDAAYYFSGDCNLKNGDNNRCIMQNKTLITKFPKSNYLYEALKNLLQAYYNEELYKDALDVTEKMLSLNQKLAFVDEIDRKKADLKRIIGGTDKKIVEMESNFDKKGKTSTKSGRIIGTELVQIYSKFEDYEQNAFELATELLLLQQNDEYVYAAKNANFIATYYQKEGKYKEAGEMYLQAAEYYRSDSVEEHNAASALYSATDSFVSAGLLGDASATAQLLRTLYPDSKQAKKVNELIK